MANVLVVLRDPSGSTAIARLPGTRVLERYGPHVLTVEADDEQLEAIAQMEHVKGVYAGTAPEPSDELSESEQLGISAWNSRQSEAFRSSKKHRSREGLSWDTFGPDEEV